VERRALTQRSQCRLERQGLKPDVLAIIYGPTKVVP
jgi:hypothetical protein